MSELLHFTLKFLNKHSFGIRKIKEKKFMDIQLGVIILLLLLLGGQRRQNYGNLTVNVTFHFTFNF